MESHLPLVWGHIRRHVPTPSRPMRTREQEDLLQEGCMALAVAAARYDPNRDGEFAAFALPRIRGAIHRALHDRFTLIRIPSQARLKVAGAEVGLAGQGPVRMSPISELLEQPMHSREALEESSETIRHALRRRYETLALRVLADMRRRRWLRRNPCEIMAAFVHRRLLVESRGERASIGQIAREFAVSKGRASAYELALRREVRSAVQADPQTRELLVLAREDPDGKDGVIDEERRARLQEAEVRAFEQRFQGMPPPAQAEAIYAMLQRSSDCLPEVARNLFRMTFSLEEPERRTVA